MESVNSVSQEHQQQPWNVSQQQHHQVVLHPYQQKPHPQQCNHVKPNYDLAVQILIQVKRKIDIIHDRSKSITHRLTYSNIIPNNSRQHLPT